MLQDRGRLIVGGLSRLLNTSEDTLRRDLRELDEAGLLLRVRGGALPRTTTPAAYRIRQEQGHFAESAEEEVAVLSRLLRRVVHNLDPTP